MMSVKEYALDINVDVENPEILVHIEINKEDFIEMLNYMIKNKER